MSNTSSFPSTTTTTRDHEAISSSLWKISSGKNGDKYLLFSGNRARSTNASTGDDANSDNPLINNQTIRVYKMRWYILAVICFANISNAFNWINFSSIADFAGKFYTVDYDAINYLSLSYLIIAIPAGFFSFWLIDNFGLRSSVNLGAWFNFLGACIRVISSIDSASGTPIVSQSYKYTVLIVGQCLCALAQPFIMFVSSKFANTWFAEDQRSLANTLALGSNTVGILIGAFVSPIIVNSSVSFISQMCFLNLIACGISLFPALMACFITRSTPKCPPSYSQLVNNNQRQSNNIESTDGLLNASEESAPPSLTFSENFKIYLSQIGKLLKSKDFFILTMSFGLSLGLFNGLTTLIEQIFCTRGYTDDDAGYFGGAMIVSGIVGSVISGLILDKTKRFEELAKICFAMSALSNIFLVCIQLYDNDKSTIYYLLMLSFVITGFFGLPLLPICMEMSIECVYPIPEATSTGLLFIAGQVFGIIMIICYPKLAKIVDKDSYVYNSVQTCLNTNSNSSLTTTAASSVSALSVLDFKIPLFGQALLLTIIAILFIIFFKCAYLRLRSEREKLAEQILNSARVLN
jgi:MFS transporter, FLVCR family, MFS-domain-containing protein 7